MNIENENKQTTENTQNILFVDDEFGDLSQVQLHDAVDKLKEKGFNVETVTTMAEAIDAFMSSKFYHVLILDIDMHKTLSKDKFQSSETKDGAEPQKRGSDLAHVYMSLDNGCRIVIYSGAGEPEDMFKLANSHVYGYVRKGADGVEKLVNMVTNASQHTDMGIRLPMPRTSGKVLIIQMKDSPLNAEGWDRIVGEISGDFTAVFSVASTAANLLSKEDFAAVVIAASKFSPHDMADLKKICAVQPRPHVIMACDITQDNKYSILDTVNLRPIRLVNLLPVNKEEELVKALQSALNWYDGWETFESSLHYIHQVAAKINWELYEDDNQALTEELYDDFSREDSDDEQLGLDEDIQN